MFSFGDKTPCKQPKRESPSLRRKRNKRGEQRKKTNNNPN
jgi:hypothetical protein